MHAAHRPHLARHGRIHLHPGRLKAVIGKLVRAEGAGEEAALIFPLFDIDAEGAGDGKGRELHPFA